MPREIGMMAPRPSGRSAALTAAATGLHGEGQVLGATLNQASTYLALMLPYLATEESDFALLGPVADNVAASTPALSPRHVSSPSAAKTDARVLNAPRPL